MWDQWKKKIRDLFFEEIHEENEQQETIRNDKKEQSIHTKVTYQYPNKNSFRFPVIPDQKSEKQTMEKPAFERKNGNRQHHNTRRTMVEKRSSNRNQTDEKKSDSKVQHQKSENKNENKPFRPTQVASPIYGFNPRKKEKELDEVPAFVRKQNTEKKELQEEVYNQIKQEATINKVEQIEKQTTNHVDSEQKNTEFNQKNGGQRADREFDSIESFVESNKQSSTHNERKNNEHSNKREEKNKNREDRQSLSKQSNAKKKESVLPFNVMMSANDKRRYKEKIRKHVAPVQTETNSVIPFHLLNDPAPENNQDKLWITNQQELLEKTLKYFNVRAKVVNATQGPAVTRFEVQPELGVKVSKVKNLSDDLKLNMAAKDIRIEAPIPGKNTIGIEIPNPKSQMVGLQEIFAAESFKNSSSPLTIGLGLNIEGSPLVTNIQKMPHGLIAGATGSGKSVCINTILVSLLYKANHDEVKFLLIDPKMVELAPYNSIPHLVSPVITDVKAATIALKWAVGEMEERYEKFVHEGVRDIERYNQKMKKQNRIDEQLPFLVIVIDELADLMMVSPQDVEDAICRIAQKARACGIHLLVATQRPSVDVITGLIKSNIPTRIAFSVSSQVDSRTIIDTSGAEKLLGKGDMLFVENGAGKSIRLQGAFVSDEEIERVTKYARSIAPPNYLFEQEQLLEQIAVEDDADELIENAIEFVVEHNSASTSLLQRHFKIGYNRAARLMDSMEAKGIIAPQNGSKPREVLISPSQIESMQE
ncbi:DNA translocase FtsK [Virgibacillus oceani]|uniref:DNA translocase SftA n=1 Tax=Virgibacillus oceani TaxID=1479511 RepID=A0A917HPH9_9BACI|nr:DNA translocase FtsK [Virgibacillus oceani]GGG84993.1 DNA translocase SftA [Virgibacillus oceani]